MKISNEVKSSFNRHYLEAMGALGGNPHSLLRDTHAVARINAAICALNDARNIIAPDLKDEYESKMRQMLLDRMRQMISTSEEVAPDAPDDVAPDAPDNVGADDTDDVAPDATAVKHKKSRNQ